MFFYELNLVDEIVINDTFVHVDINSSISSYPGFLFFLSQHIAYFKGNFGEIPFSNTLTAFPVRATNTKSSSDEPINVLIQFVFPVPA